MSRPSMSVPNQYAADGSRVRRCVASVVGSTVHRYGASNAISSMSATSAPPTAIAGCRRTKPQTGRAPSEPEGCRAVRAPPQCPPAPAWRGPARSIADPRIDQRVDEIDGEIDEHVDEAEEQH